PVGTRAANVPNTTFMLMTGGLAELTGTVTCNGNPVAGALVEVDNTTRSALTNADGEYTIPYLNPGTVNITTSKLGYIDTHTTGIVLVADETTTQNIVIEQLPYVEISGVVKNGTNGQVISGATVRLTGYENYEVTSEADGSFTIDEVYTNHDYTLSVLKGGFVVYTDEVEVGTNDIDLGDIELETNPALVELLVGDLNATTTAYYYPINYFYKASMTQAIYMEDELNVGYCLGDQAAVTSIKYYATLNGDIPAGKPLKIWMANTEQSAFTSTSNWISYDDFTLVFGY
ncbi:MAG TPA: carboxypeptidase-like regulatory domain-containing protein, partial [Candidatus Cloacimonadota bacterium]|nr:carboxypeptidase-like regulatory domain-containing protein [Candidatus Cloacimonadota bacterium]